jgi:O-antigen ligase
VVDQSGAGPRWLTAICSASAIGLLEGNRAAGVCAPLPWHGVAAAPRWRPTRLSGTVRSIRVMTGLASRLSRPPREAAAPTALLLVALCVGLVTGVDPGAGVALAAALVFALVVIWDLALGVCLFLLVTFLDVVSSNQDLSLTKGAGAVLAISWLAQVATRRRAGDTLAVHTPHLVAVVIAFLAWSALSAVWAESPAAATRSTVRFGLDALLIPIVFWALRGRKHVVWVFGIFVLGALLSVLWGLTQGKAAGGAAAAQVGRLAGANVEANQLATLLVVCIVFASALSVALRRAPLGRFLAMLAAIAAMAAFFSTFSRAGMVSLAVVLLAGCIYAGRSRPAFVALVIGAVVVGSVFLQETSSSAVKRLTSTTTSGRSDIWKVGLRMVSANPVVGVGSGNYTIAEPHYYLIAPGAIKRGEFIVDRPYVAHNIYLHVLAEMGVVGLALFLSVIVLSMRAAVQSVGIFRRTGERSLEIMGRALIIALAGILAADFFASDQYSKQLWMLLGMGPALLAIARRLSESQTGLVPVTQAAALDRAQRR